MANFLDLFRARDRSRGTTPTPTPTQRSPLFSDSGSFSSALRNVGSSFMTPVTPRAATPTPAPRFTPLQPNISTAAGPQFAPPRPRAATPAATLAPPVVPPPTPAASNLTKVPTGSVGPGGPIFNVFAGTEHIKEGDPRLRGVNIAGLPLGQAPTEFRSQFEPVQGAPPIAPTVPGAPPVGPEMPFGAPGGPSIPVIPPESQEAVTRAETAVQKALEISPEQLSTQKDLDKLIESTRKSFLDIEDQPIALPFITGQLRSVENRALGLAEPLERKLARLEATRRSALSASQFALKRADVAAGIAREEAAPGESFTLGAGQTRFGPTGEVIAQAPEAADEGFTLGKDQVRFDSQGNVLASNIGSSGLSGGFGGAGYVRGENPTVDSWVDNINNEQATLANVPGNLKNAVSNALAAGGSTETDAVKTQILQDKIDTINGLITHPGMSKSVGPTGLARFTPFKIDTWTGDVQDFVAGVHQLTAKETLDYLINLKAQGGTLGALNQSELDILKESASKINDWEIKKKGEPTGKWNASESRFKAELVKLRTLTERALARAKGTEAEEGEDEYTRYLISIGVNPQ